jgi:hypothetical protein
LPLYDGVDGTKASYSYRLQALDSNGVLLKEFGAVTVPQHLSLLNGVPTVSSKANAAKNSVAPTASAVNPIVNSAFITDEIFEDVDAMNAQQIRDLLEYKGSFLQTTSLSDFVFDTDGSQFNPAIYIKQLAQQYRINPQVILVSMQKESRLLVQPTIPSKQPNDGWMGAKGCAKTFQAQLDCGVSRLRKYLSDIDANGQTIGGWAPLKENFTCAGGDATCPWEKVAVTPANRAAAALWQYTPVAGTAWNPDTKDNLGNAIGGQASFLSVWYSTAFKNLVNIIRWSFCVVCPEAPQVSFANPGNSSLRGNFIRFGPANFTPTEGAQQAISSHGVSGPLPPNTGYKVDLSCELNTWDSYNPASGEGTGYWDVFLVNITPVKYWDSSRTDPISAPFKFGGVNYADGLPSSLKKRIAIEIPAGSNQSFSKPFFNVMLDTAADPDFDRNYPSWGECTVREIIPVDPIRKIIRMPS